MSLRVILFALILVSVATSPVADDSFTETSLAEELQSEQGGFGHLNPFSRRRATPASTSADEHDEGHDEGHDVDEGHDEGHDVDHGAGHDEEGHDEDQDDSKPAPAPSPVACSQDTGGTCFLNDCYKWRKHTKCENFKCVCPPNRCAYQGTCLEVGQRPPAPPPPVCEMNTGGTCRFTKCESWRNAQCTGVSFGFTSGITLGQCVCSEGFCAIKGKCVKSHALTAPPKSLSDKQIVCPVLASLRNAGFFKPDAYGRIERLKIQAGISKGLGADAQTAWFFGLTTAGYTKADVAETNFRMVNPIHAKELLKKNATKNYPGEDRYLNIYRMDKNPDIMHQIAAAARGGPLDPKCGSPPAFPCLSRYERFFGRFAKNGRIYAEQLGNIAGHIFENGFHGVAAKTTLFTLTQGFTGREFLALAGWLACFGIKDSHGNRYIPEKWTKTMVMKGHFPKAWKRRPDSDQWGSDDVLAIVRVWVKQGVPGVSDALKAISYIESLTAK